MSRTYRTSAHTFKRIADKANKNNLCNIFKGDWKQDKQMGIESHALKRARFKAKEDIKNYLRGLHEQTN